MLCHETRDDERERGECQTSAICGEVGRVPGTAKEDGEAAEEGQDDRDEIMPCSVWLVGGPVWEEISVVTLGVPASPEAGLGLRRKLHCEPKTKDVAG